MISQNFLLTTLAHHPEFYDDVIALIEKEFHYSNEHNFEEDFAPLLNPLNFENCFLYVDTNTNKVVAHIAASKRTLVKNHCNLDVIFIGGIVTHPNYRGQSLFKNLFEHVIMKYNESVGLFILWSELENLYEKFSFHRAGGLIETGTNILANTESFNHFEKSTFSHISNKDFKEIQNLYSDFNQKYFFTTIRNERDWSIIREMSTVDLYYQKNTSGEIHKYFCINKGQDLNNIIHEVSASNYKKYKELINEIKFFRLWLPESELSIDSSQDIFYTAFFRLGNINKLNEFLLKITQNELEVHYEKEKIQFIFNHQTHTCSQKEFLQFLLGPKPLTEFLKFNLSLYIPGIDSI